MEPPPNPFRLHRCEWEFILVSSDEFLFFLFFFFYLISLLFGPRLGASVLLYI